MGVLNKKHLFLLLLLWFVEFSIAQNQPLIIENTAFKIGERLRYEVKYGIIKGGEAEMSIDLTTSGYDYAYYVKALARTTGAIGGFVRIYDVYESIINLETGYPIMAVRNIREQKYLWYNEVVFDHKKNTVRSLKSGIHQVPPNVLDILSAFYYARRYLFKKKLNKNDIIRLDTYFADELFTIAIRYKKTEKIRSKFGKIECLKFVPVIEKGGSFQKEKDLQIWVTNDLNYIPIKIQADLPVSKIKVDLIGFKGIRNKFGQLKK